METLGKAANLSVFKPSEKITDDENSESDDSDVDDGTHCNVQKDEQDDVDQDDEDVIYDDPGRRPDATIVFGLVGEIARWQHASTPSQ